jgi:hypothetical protein
MSKPDITKLVADALEAEFGSYRNAELQHITAWNDGQHGESQAVCLLLTKKGESLKAFKDREFSWMRHLFGQRLDLDYSAGLLLGFSRGMTEDAIFVDANKSNLKLPLSLRKRPISAVLVKAFTDRKDAIANSDINKPHVTTYDVGELIAWAKEKGFVADEVLAAWEAYNKPEPVKAEQETGKESITTEPEQSKQEKVPRTATGMTTREIGAVFDGLPFKAENWPKRASGAKWLSDANLLRGVKGGASSMWCPFEVAKASFNQASERDRPKRLKDLNNRFKTNPALGPWRDVWDKFYIMFNDAD